MHTTASPRNFDYLRSLGADAVYDYNDGDAETLAARIRDATGGALALAWDCSPTPESARTCALAMKNSDGDKDETKALYSSLLPIDPAVVKGANPRADSEWTLGYTAFGEEFSRMGKVFPAKPEDRAFAAEFWERSRELLAAGTVKVARTAVDQGGAGVEGILRGLDDLKEGRVSGTKLVYRL